MQVICHVFMKRVSALDLRQSMGRIVARLERTGEPIVLEKGRKPVAVLISLRDFEERFVETAAAEARIRILDRMDSLARPSEDRTPAVEVLRDLRGEG